MTFGECTETLGEKLKAFTQKRDEQDEEDAKNIEKKHVANKLSRGVRVWNGDPNSVNSTIILQTYTMKQVEEALPIDTNDIPRDLKVGACEKINHGTLTSKDGSTLTLWIERVEKVDEYYKAPGIFPIENENADRTKPVVLYSDVHNNGVIEEDAKAAQVSSVCHACQLLGRKNEALNGLEENETKNITASNGNKFIAKQTRGGESGLGSKYNDLPKPNRFVPDNCYTNKTKVGDLEKINAHHAKTGEWTRSILPKKATNTKKRKSKEEKSANKSKGKKAPSKKRARRSSTKT